MSACSGGKPMVLFGTACMARIMLRYYEDANREVVALCVDRSHLPESRKALGLPVVAFEDVQDHYPPDQYELCIAAGYHGLNSFRAERFVAAADKGYELAGYVHPSAVVADSVTLGKGCIVQEGCVIQGGTILGQGVVLGPGCMVSHDCRIGDWVWMAATRIGGECCIGDHTFLGLNSTISSGLAVGRHCIVGAAAVILENLADESAVLAANDAPLALQPGRIHALADRLLYGRK